MANPDYVFIEGFDKYARPGDSLAGRDVLAILKTGEWNNSHTSDNRNWSIQNADVGGGYRIACNTYSGGVPFISKLLPGNYRRCIGGFTHTKVGGTVGSVEVRNDTTLLFSISVNSLGKIVVSGGAVSATSDEFLTESSPQFIEWDLYIDNSAGWIRVWLDGQMTSINLSGVDTQGSSSTYNNFYAVFDNFNMDHLYTWHYVDDTSPDTPCLTNPIIETSWASSDNTVDFLVGQGVMGDMWVNSDNTSISTGANQVVVTRVYAECDADLTHVCSWSLTNSLTSLAKGVVYSDNAGEPDALLAEGTEVVGRSSGSVLQLPLSSPLAVTAGTWYWVGILTNTSVAESRMNSIETQTRRVGQSYGSGAPNPIGSVSIYTDTMYWGRLENIDANFNQVIKRAVILPELSYNYSTTVGDEDLYNMESLINTPAAVYCVAVKTQLSKTDAGIRLADVRLNSGGVTDSGNTPNQSVLVGRTFHASYWMKNPDGDVDWNGPSVNGTKAGVKLVA